MSDKSAEEMLAELRGKLAKMDSEWAELVAMGGVEPWMVPIKEAMEAVKVAARRDGILLDG